MKISELTENAHDNAQNKGFWEHYDSVIESMYAELEKENRKFDHRKIEATAEAYLCQKLLLISSEVNEAMEALRNGYPEEFEVELADILVRTGDLAGKLGIDLEKRVQDKMKKNKDRSTRHGGRF